MYGIAGIKEEQLSYGPLAGNPLNYGGRNPTMSLQIVPGKVFPDWAWKQEAEANGKDRRIQEYVYPGATIPESFNYDVGGVSIGVKDMRTHDLATGEATELGLASAAGISMYNYSCHRSAEANLYFQGFIATECRNTAHHMDANTHDPDQGYAIVRAGLTNYVNASEYTYTPGMRLRWRLPRLPTKGEDVAMSPWEIVPFDYTEFGMFYASALATMGTTRANGGISDFTLADYFKCDGIAEAPSYSTEQEEAGGHKNSKIGILLAGIATLARKGYITINANKAAETDGVREEQAVERLAEAIGLWSTDLAGGALTRELFTDMFFMQLNTAQAIAARDRLELAFPGKNMRNVGLAQLSGNEPRDNYLALRARLDFFDSSRLAGNWFQKTSNVVGMCTNTAPQGYTANVLAGMFAL